MTINPTVIDFISKQCKCGLHRNCYGKWVGLGFEVVCGCKKCGHNKLDEALAEVQELLANAIHTDADIITRAGDNNGNN